MDRSPSSTRRWAIGLLVGLVAGAGALIAGPLAWLLGLVAAILLVAEPPRLPGAAGAAIGLGGALAALLLRADLACGANCVGPDLTPWYAASAALVAVGLMLTGSALLRARAGAG
jgi:hypothetical protein